jgi:hypothetical protein
MDEQDFMEMCDNVVTKEQIDKLKDALNVKGENNE